MKTIARSQTVTGPKNSRNPITSFLSAPAATTQKQTPPQRGFLFLNQGNRYSGFAPEAFTTFAHFLISDLM